MPTIKVQKHGTWYGITDGNLWFFYAYETQERAEAILSQNFKSVFAIRVNVSYPAPLQLVSEKDFA